MTKDHKFRVKNPDGWQYYSLSDMEARDGSGGDGWNLNTLGLSTTRKDKNGVEIYQDDIIKTEDDHWGERSADDPIVVTWVEEQAGFDPFGICGACAKQWVDPETCEVIGNSHDNPELVP